MRMMRQGRIVLALLIILIWGSMPLALDRWGRVPHTHIFVGEVTSQEFVAHLVAEVQRDAMHEPPHYQGGWILSVPFGDLGAFLAFLLVIAPPAAAYLNAPQFARALGLFVYALAQIHLEIPHPPPRFGFSGHPRP